MLPETISKIWNYFEIKELPETISETPKTFEIPKTLKLIRNFWLVHFKIKISEIKILLKFPKFQNFG